MTDTGQPQPQPPPPGDSVVMSSNEHLSLEAPDAKIKTKRKGLFNNKLEMSYQVSCGSTAADASSAATTTTTNTERKISDASSFILSLSLPDEGTGAQFESFSCTDEDSCQEEGASDDDEDVSDVDSDVDSSHQLDISTNSGDNSSNTK